MRIVKPEDPEKPTERPRRSTKVKPKPVKEIGPSFRVTLTSEIDGTLGTISFKTIKDAMETIDHATERRFIQVERSPTRVRFIKMDLVDEIIIDKITEVVK